MKARVLFCLKNRDNHFTCDPPYAHYMSSGLYNSARFICDMLTSNGFCSKIVHVPDANSIYKEVKAFKADVVIIEALWVIPKKFDELKRVCPKVTFVVRNHSELPFLASDGIFMEWILAYASKPNVLIATNSLRSLEENRFLVQKSQPSWTFREVNLRAVYLPNFYPTANAVPPKSHTGNLINVGCFGAVRPLKSQLIQATAALKYATRHGKTLNFHMNGSRVESNGSPVLKNIIQLFKSFPKDKLVLYGWQTHAAFIAIVQKMDLMMQVSLSETFNIVAADAVVNGTAVVVSPEISWIPKIFQANPTDSEDISAKIETAINYPTTQNLLGLEKFSEDSSEIWISFLSRF